MPGHATLCVTSRVIIRSFLEEFRFLAVPVLEGVDRRSALEHGLRELSIVERSTSGRSAADRLWPRAQPQIAQRVAITGSQVSTVVLLNHTAEETGYDRHPFYRATLLVAIDISKHRHEVLIGIPAKSAAAA